MTAAPTGTASATSELEETSSERGRGKRRARGSCRESDDLGSDRRLRDGRSDEGCDAGAECMRLSLVGFSASEIAGMLQTTVPTVHQNLYAERKKLKPSEKKSRTAGKRSKS